MQADPLDLRRSTFALPMRPRIGITTSLNDGEQRLDRAYVRAVEAAGGLPLPVPMLDTDAAAADFAALLHGLVVTGGPAVTEGLVGVLPADLDDVDPVRLASDRRLLGLFLAQCRPVLGICYGMQLASALRGGTLYGDVQAERPGTAVHSQKRGGTTHVVRVAPGTHLRRLLGTDALEVNTRHLQAVADPGAGLRVAATADDGVIEALETADGRFLGVQFHPERMGPEATPLFRHLVAAAAAAAYGAAA
jgi:putative glutamine amidotransferase